MQRPQGKTQAEVLYREAQELYKNKRYILAVEKLGQIRSRYPYSYYATHAELLGAEILFAQENYQEAAAAFIVFKDFHPKHKKLAHVFYRIAESFYLQLPSTFDRDLTPGFEAIKYYRELIRRFPRSRQVKMARERIADCRKRIQDKERYIADFYFKTDVYDSARYRYLMILKDFKKNKRIRDHSMVRIIRASAALGDKAACKKYYKKYKGLIAATHTRPLAKAYEGCLN